LAETTVVVPLPLGVTVKVYDVPLVSPVTVQCCAPVGAVVVLITVQVKLPGVEVTTYVEATPSAVKFTTTEPLAAVPIVGVARAETVVTAADASEAPEVPPLLGVTLKVYAVALASPVTVQLCAPVGTVWVLATTQVLAPMVPPEAFDTVYVVAAPSATNETVTAPVPALATVGVARRLFIVTEFDAADTVVRPVPLPLAKTVALTMSLLVRPVKVTLCVPAATAVVPPTPTVLTAFNAGVVASVRLTVYNDATPSASHVTVTVLAPGSVAFGAPAAVAPSVALDTVIGVEAAETVEEVPLPLGVTINVSAPSVTMQLCVPVSGVETVIVHVSAVLVTPLTT
jgi:hypothetical protein